MHTRRVSTLLIALALLVAGCDSGGSNSQQSDDSSDTPDETVVADDAVVVDPAEASLQSMRGDTLTFSLTDDAPDFETGTVVVGEEDGGFLRRVVSVESSGGQATLLTEPAALTDVLEKGELSKTIDLSAEASKDGRGWTAVRTAPGVRAKAANLGIQLDGVSVTGSATSNLDITLSNGQAAYTPEIDVEVDVEDGSIQSFRLASSGTIRFNTDVQVAAQSSITESVSTSLARFQKAPILYFIGPVPVTVQPVLEFVGSCTAGFQQAGTVTTGVEAENTVTLGAAYENGGWQPVSSRETTLDARPLEWNQSFSAEASCSVRPELSFKFYQVAGPFINAGPYVRGDLESASDAWEWDVYTGLNAGFGGKVEFLDVGLASYEHTFSLAETKLAGDSGSLDPTTIVEGTARTPDGATLPNFRVRLMGDQTTYTDTTTADGTFSLEVESGSYDIEGDAVRDTTRYNVVSRQTSVSVAEGETRSVTLDTEEGYYMNLSNVRLAGEPGPVTAAPGEDLSLQFDYTAWSRSGNSTAVVYAAAGVEGTGQEAADLGVTGSAPGEQGAVTLTVTAPSETGTYTVYVLESPQLSESEALSEYENTYPDPFQFIPVATLEVQSGGGTGGLDGPTYAPGNGYTYFATEQEYDPDNVDISAEVKAEYGSDAQLADWSTLKDLYAGDESGLVAFLDGIGLTDKGDSGWVLRSGTAFYSGDRHYFLKRHEGDVSGSFLVHDELHGNLVSLGSWYNPQKALVRVPK